MRHKDASRITDGTSGASFAIDERMQILSWNRGAVRLLGHRARDVLGKPCHEVIYGSDIFGNRYCNEDCPLLKMVRKGEPVHCLQLDVANLFNERVRINVQPVVIPGPRPSEFGHQWLKKNAQAVEDPPAHRLQNKADRHDDKSVIYAC